MSRYVVFIQRLCLLINLICWGSSLVPGARPGINPNCDLHPRREPQGAGDETIAVLFFLREEREVWRQDTSKQAGEEKKQRKKLSVYCNCSDQSSRD